MAVKPPPKSWEYIFIELEIDEKVVDSRIASKCTFESLYVFLIREGQTQTLPWAVYISKWYYKKAYNTTKPY